jgi:hypothetical protein
MTTIRLGERYLEEKNFNCVRGCILVFSLGG